MTALFISISTVFIPLYDMIMLLVSQSLVLFDSSTCCPASFQPAFLCSILVHTYITRGWLRLWTWRLCFQKKEIWTNNALLLCVWSSKFSWMSHLTHFTIVSTFLYGPFERGLVEHPIARSHSILRNLEGFWNPLWGLWCFRVSGYMKVDSWHFFKHCAFALMDVSLQGFCLMVAYVLCSY